VDVTTTPEAGLLHAPDEDQLAFAVSQGRVIISQDTDFLRIGVVGLEDSAHPTQNRNAPSAKSSAVCSSFGRCKRSKKCGPRRVHLIIRQHDALVANRVAIRAKQHEIVRRVEALFWPADAIEKRAAAATTRADKLT
jgi:hypothetical protein